MRRFVVFTACMMMASSSNALGVERVKTTRAAWMEGAWGVRIFLPGGDRPEIDREIENEADLKARIK